MNVFKLKEKSDYYCLSDAYKKILLYHIIVTRRKLDKDQDTLVKVEFWSSGSIFTSDFIIFFSFSGNLLRKDIIGVWIDSLDS